MEGEYYECNFYSNPYRLQTVDIKKIQRACNPQYQIIVAVSSTLGAFVFILTAYVAYRKRWWFRHQFFVLKTYVFATGDDNKRNFKYDAFILYCSDDEDRLWVHRLFVHKLEIEYEFNVCIHHRDFLAGIPIVDNIMDAIQNSRKVIAVVSPNFLKSQWCNEEIHLTDYIDRGKLIIVLLKDIALGECAIQPVMRFLLETRTYIEWTEDEEGEKLFWKKIVRAMYAH